MVSPRGGRAGMTTLGYTVLTVRERPATGYPKPRLLDRVREAVRARHYSPRTEKTYVAWIKRYIFFHSKRHPADMGAAGGHALSDVARDRRQGRRIHPESGPERVAVPVSGAARAGSAVARRSGPRPAALSGCQSSSRARRSVASWSASTARLASWPCCSTAPASGFSSALAFASKTSTSPRARSWSGAARAPKIE